SRMCHGTGTNLPNGAHGGLVGSALSPINPLLGPLQNNGGPTATLALLPGSRASDAGDPTVPGLPTTDQRGLPRTVAGAVDIGAFELGLTRQERFVEALYLDELGRAGSMAEVDGWVGVLNAPGGSQQAVTTAIAGSPEARDHLVKGWYITILGRQANGTEEQGWVNALASQSEDQVLSGILATPEFY